jgi:PKD repeat protein
MISCNQITNFTLTVAKGGTGTGTVTSNPSGINCGTVCSATYASGSSVVLTAAATSGSTFAGWFGAGCSGTGICTVAMTQNQSATANFNLAVLPPTANFSFSPGSPTVGQPVQFTDTSTGSPTSWSWTFGDGGTSTAKNPSHTYLAVGSFPVSLTATYAASSSTITKTISVAAGSAVPQGVTLSRNRVLVTVDWRNPYGGESGRAYAIPQDDKFAFFYYSDRTNPEIFVKVLDFGSGTALCFVGGLTDFYYKVTFTMLRTGQPLVFEKPEKQYIGFVDTTTLRF